MAQATKPQKTETTAKAHGNALGISTKQSIEVCSHIRGRHTDQAKKILNEAISLKVPIPVKRFCNGVGHRRGRIGTGYFAPKTCKAILKVIQAAEANAQFKGINSSNLKIKEIFANRATSNWRYGRKSRQLMKATHIDVVVEESEPEKKNDRKRNNPKKA